MKRLILFMSLLIALTLPIFPATAQNFGLEDGDDIDLLMPGEASAAEAEQQDTSGSGSAVVLAAPSRVGEGRAFLVRLTADQPLDSVSIHWLGKEVMPAISVWNNRHVALAMLGTDVLNAKPGKKELSVIASIDGKENTFRRTIQITSVDYPKQELSLPKKMVTPPTEVLEKIKADRAEVAKAKNTVSPKRYWRLPFERPVSGKMTSPYGVRRILNGKPKSPHRGLDFRSPMGNPVKNTADGVVLLVGDHYYAGTSIYIDHGNGVVSMYFHLSKPMVKEGDTVKRGQIIGLSGMTGRATGPHLHFSVSVLGQLVDPEPLLKDTVDTMLQ